MGANTSFLHVAAPARASRADARRAPDRHAEALYRTLHARLRDQIVAGAWRAGTRVPSSRLLAERYGISRNTALQAIGQLVAEGWAEARHRSGVYVASDRVRIPTAASPKSDGALHDDLEEAPLLAADCPATDIFPIATWARMQAKVARELGRVRFRHVDLGGHAGLRSVISTLVCTPRGLAFAPSQIFVVPSRDVALVLALRAVARPGDEVIVEDPVRPEIVEAVRSAGFVPRFVPVGRHGLDMAQLPAASSARVCICQPAVQFPTCTTMSDRGRQTLRHWARQGDRWIIEIDEDHDARFDRLGLLPPLASGADADRVIYVDSFNRSLFPALGLAFLAVPPGLTDRLRTQPLLAAYGPNVIAQAALAAFIERGHYAMHQRKRRQEHDARRLALLDLLKRFPGVTVQRELSRQGMHLVVRARNRPDAELAHALGRAGLGGDAMQDYAVEAAGAGILLGFANCPAASFARIAPLFDRVFA